MDRLKVGPADPAGVWTVAELVELAASSPALREALRDAWNLGWHAGFKDVTKPGVVEATPNPFVPTAVGL